MTAEKHCAPKSAMAAECCTPKRCHLHRNSDSVKAKANSKNLSCYPHHLSRAMPNRIIGIERRACRPLEMAEPAGSVDVIFGNTSSSTKPHAAPIARVRLAHARYLVCAHRHDRVVDCRGRLFCVAQRRHSADG